MNIFNLREKKFFLIWFFAILLIIFQILPRKDQDNFLFKLFHGGLGGIQTASVNFQLEINSLADKYLFLLHLHDENLRLKRENNQLEVKNQVLKEIQIENERLRELMNLQKKSSHSFLVAHVTSRNFLSDSELITINKGSQHGIKKYMGVIHLKGAIGHVFRVSPYSSQIISLKNQLSALPAGIQKSRLTGLVEGQLSRGILFKYFDLNPWNTYSIKKDDVVVTSSSKYFPPGIPIGEVTSLKEGKIEVKPYVNLDEIEEVLIITNLNKSEIADE